jgi:hypothetical protein
MRFAACPKTTREVHALREDMSAPGETTRFRVDWVHGCIDAALRTELVAFWLEQGAIDGVGEAWRRSYEVACVLRDAAGALAGVCSVALGVDEGGDSYGFLRAFVRPGSRAVRSSQRLLVATAMGFERLAGEPGGPKRLVITLENRKLERQGMRRKLARLGFAPIGATPGGEVIMQRSLRG